MHSVKCPKECSEILETAISELQLANKLSNFHRALKSPGHLYFTVELADSQDIEEAYRAGKDKGLPVGMGESAHEEGYHYYPSMEQVRDWIREANFCILEEAGGDEYQHFWVKKLDDLRGLGKTRN